MVPRIRARGGPVDRGAAREHRETGRAAYERGAYALALASFEKAAREDPRSPWTWIFTAQARLRLGDRPGSYEAVERALELRPNEPTANWHLVLLLEEDGRIDECRMRVLRLCEAHPDEPGVLRRGVETLVRLGDLAAVGQLADRLLARDPQSATAVAAIAMGLQAAGEAEEARRVLQTRLAPGSTAGVVAGATVAMWSGRPQEAWRAVESLPPREVGVALLAELGRVLRRVGDLGAATDAYRAAATLDPDYESAEYWADVNLGESIVASGRWHAVPSHVDSVQGVPGRVLHIVGKSRPFAQVGYTIRTHYVVTAQKALGLDPHVVTQFGFPVTYGVEDAPTSQLFDGIPHHHLLPDDGILPVRPDLCLTANLEQLASLVREIRPAVLHAASDFQNGLLALRLGELYALPVVYEVRGFWEESWLAKADRDMGSDAYRWRQERETACMQRADAVVTLSEGMADEIAARGIERSKITLVPNGVDVERFVPVGRDPDLAGRWGIKPEDVTLGYVSTYTPYEGVQYLLQAAAIMIRKGLPVRVVLVGEGKYLPTLQRLVMELDIPDRVSFCGRVEHKDVLSYYGIIDIFVVPRTADRVSHLVTPLKPLEAMATGRAMIVSGVDALRGMVQEGVTAEVFRPEDADHLAEVAERLVLDPDRRAALGVAARAWVSENRTWPVLATRYLDVYRGLGALA